MELQDYLRMLRRGWLTVVVVTAVGVGLASLYAALAPRVFDATTVLFVSAGDPTTISDLQQGAQFVTSAVVTYSEIIDSSTVLGPVAEELRLRQSVDDLAAMVTVSVREETTLIDVTVSGETPELVATVANAAADSAIRIIPTLQATPKGQPLVRLQQIRPAVEPTIAGSPDVQRILTVGLVVGLCVGLGATIARQTLNTRIRRPDDVRDLTGIPLLGVLPRWAPAQRLPQRKKVGGLTLVVRDDPSSAAGEAFRTLRTNLRFLESRDLRSLVFTTVADDQHGAEVAANLAWTLAQAGQRVLLVDLDLRRSSVGEAVGIRPGTGLADVLTRQADLSDVIHDTTNPLLRIVLAGTPQPNPSDLLSAPHMTSLLRQMERDYDYVILHAPPLLPYADAAVISAAAAGTFVSVAAGRTKAHEVTTALGALANVQVRPLGMVLTGARRADSDGHGVRGKPAAARRHERQSHAPTPSRPAIAAADSGPSRRTRQARDGLR
ncbi:MAG: polysaccharide biosynthesis tyrosine autokinase [Pseudonocardiaceae bacterium]